MFARFFITNLFASLLLLFCNNKGNINKGWDTMNIRITDEAKATIHRLEREDKRSFALEGQ